MGEPDSFGQTPLHLAALRGNYSVVEYLVMDCSAPLDLEDVNDKTPLDLAVKKQNKQVGTGGSDMVYPRWRAYVVIAHQQSDGFLSSSVRTPKL